MIERVRQAAIKSWKNKRPNQIDVINAMILDQEFFTDIIKAMREPTEKMVKAGKDRPYAEAGLNTKYCWENMIDSITDD